MKDIKETLKGLGFVHRVDSNGNIVTASQMRLSEDFKNFRELVYLPTLLEFVKSLRSEWESQSALSRQAERSKRYRKIDAYANFIEQELKVCMFIPCDKDGNILKENISEQEEYFIRTEYDCAFHGYKWREEVDKANERRKKEYQQAKERVLFEIPDRFERIKENWFRYTFEHYKTIARAIDSGAIICLK
jgi:hypothetical protein